LRKSRTLLLGQPAPKPRKTTHDLVPSLPDQLGAAPVQMDQKAFGRMKRGKLKPEGRIDLHGMTLDRAHPALSRFIQSAHKSGKRLVLVITGKGKLRDDGGPIPTRFGVLRHQVPQWLSMPPLSSVVLQVTQAHISHGGGGAYYVYLRRHR
jgi:DNA-nicking Smr family endonuclease